VHKFKGIEFRDAEDSNSDYDLNFSKVDENNMDEAINQSIYVNNNLNNDIDNVLEEILDERAYSKRTIQERR
jgi:hypothetical protein